MLSVLLSCIYVLLTFYAIFVMQQDLRRSNISRVVIGNNSRNPCNGVDHNLTNGLKANMELIGWTLSYLNLSF